jgi:hypothetical protein
MLGDQIVRQIKTEITQLHECDFYTISNRGQATVWLKIQRLNQP